MTEECGEGGDARQRKVGAPVECDLLWLHLSVLYIYLVATENNGDVFTDPAGNGRSLDQLASVIVLYCACTLCRPH